MLLDKSRVKNILVITLSNIGDCILTLPVIDSLKEDFKEARISLMAGPKAQDIFINNPRIYNFIIYNKHISLKDKLKLIQGLRKKNFDLVVDLRHTAIPLFLKAKHKTNPFLRIPKKYVHMKDRHLYKLEATLGYKFKAVSQSSFYISEVDRSYIAEILKKNNITPQDKVIVVSPGAATHIKRWSQKGFASVSDYLIENHDAKVIIVGDEKDKLTAAQILSKMKNIPLDLSGKTTLRQLAALFKKAVLLISNDSAVMHLGSYLDIPTVAIFGPTDEKKYGPWSYLKYAVRKKDLNCAPCQKAECPFNLECLNLIGPEEVINAVEKIFKQKTNQAE